VCPGRVGWILTLPLDVNRHANGTPDRRRRGNPFEDMMGLLRRTQRKMDF
jgi:hypothetical protein